MIRLEVALVVALLAVSGWFYLDHQSVVAQRDLAEQKAVALAHALRLAEQEAEQARNDYTTLDRSFKELQMVKQQVRVVTREHKVYIKEAAASDKELESYLDQRLPAAVECVLAESCGGNPHGVR